MPMPEPPEIVATPRHDAAFVAEAGRIARQIPDDLAGSDALAWYER